MTSCIMVFNSLYMIFAGKKLSEKQKPSYSYWQWNFRKVYRFDAVVC